MRATISLLITAAVSCLAMASCATEEAERKPVPPQSEYSKIPWNSQGPVAGQGQFGMLPQNQYRR